MLRMRATLVAMSAVWPPCGGWSADGGVDFALAPALPAPAATEPEQTASPEPPSFLGPGDDAPPDATGALPSAGLAAPARGAAAIERVASGPLRAWSRLPPGPPRT